jgi:hypothetical protein
MATSRNSTGSVSSKVEGYGLTDVENTAPTGERRPRRGRCLLYTLAALVILVGAAGWAVVSWLSDIGDGDLLGTTLVDTLTREQIEKAAGVRLPAGARDLHSHYASFQDFIVHVRFELDPADLPAFLGSLPITDPQISSAERPLMYSEGMPEWWQPDAAQSFQAVSGQVALPSGAPDYQAVLVDTTDPAKSIVYIVAFDT